MCCGGGGGAPVLLPLLVPWLRNQFWCHTAPYPPLSQYRPTVHCSGDDDNCMAKNCNWHHGLYGLQCGDERGGKEGQKKKLDISYVVVLAVEIEKSVKGPSTNYVKTRGGASHMISPHISI